MTFGPGQSFTRQGHCLQRRGQNRRSRNVLMKESVLRTENPMETRAHTLRQSPTVPTPPKSRKVI
eukprot:1307691-Amphidinium_carterae.2